MSNRLGSPGHARVAGRLPRLERRGPTPGAAGIAADRAAADRARWTPSAACRNADPEIFFGRDHERPRDRAEREALAAAVCSGCPVAARCLAAALADGELGYWAGTTDEDRRSMRRRADRGAAKTAAATAVPVPA